LIFLGGHLNHRLKRAGPGIKVSEDSVARCIVRILAPGGLSNSSKTSQNKYDFKNVHTDLLVCIPAFEPTGMDLYMVR
jgi:hypothetical protein